MATEKQRAKRRARRAHIQQRERIEKEEPQEVEDLLPEEEIPEELEKDMDEMPMYMGPTSFEELDALKAAQEQAAQVRQVTWETQDLVYNILNTPMLDAKEKASKIQAVGTGFEERLAVVSKPIKKDLDVLVIEAILAEDKRHAGPLEFVGDFISKAKLTASAENSLSDEQFALVVSRDGKKERKYPIHDKAHVRNALARAAQMMQEGGEAASDAKAALPKIRAAAKKMGIEMSMEKDRNAIMIEKDLNGDWRWIGWVSNNFIDWDGDIICEDAHKEYVEWLDSNPDMAPVSTTWHMPELVRKNVTDFWAYENGFLIMSGKLTEDEAESLLKAKALTDLGMSHGTFVLARDPKDLRVILKYRMYENSDLPRDNAANPFTNFEVLTKEADMDKKTYLAQFFGGSVEKATAFLEKTGMKQKALQDADVENKEKKEEVPEVPTTPEKQEEQPAAPALDMQAIIKAVGEQYGMEDLGKAFAEVQEKADKVEVLEELVKDLQTTKEDDLAEMLTPPAARFPWMQKARASQSEKNVPGAEEEEKLKKSAPGVPEGYWLSEATGTAPVQVQ